MPLRLLLAVLGTAFAAASRWSNSFRRQLTRNVVIEIRSDDGVSRQFVFRDRRATSRPGRADGPDCAIRFATARQGFAVLTARDGPKRLVEGLLDGTVTIEGRTQLSAWFQGLVPAALPGMPVPRLPKVPPHPYIRPTSSPEVSRRITREPAVGVLDPAWTNAVQARTKLLMMRAAAGEPISPF